MKHSIETTVRIPLDEPRPAILKRVGQFRLGQLHRRKSLPCMSANGSYLDGWYSPEKEIPPYVTEAQVRAFQL